jgi:hypothetical protein
VGRGIGLVALLVCVVCPAEAPATIEAQRARLPPPADCSDPITGTWLSHAFHERFGQWGRFTLVVHRDPDDQERLVGTISNEAWYGPAEEARRGPCKGQLQYLVSMDAEGSIRGDEFVFGGVGQWRLDELFCGSLGGYNLDQFAGRVDHQLHEFQTLNNDGGRYVDVPTVFRRIACEESGEEPPRIAVDPPPFYPPPEASGCAPVRAAPGQVSGERT